MRDFQCLEAGIDGCQRAQYHWRVQVPHMSNSEHVVGLRSDWRSQSEANSQSYASFLITPCAQRLRVRVSSLYSRNRMGALVHILDVATQWAALRPSVDGRRH